MDSIGGARCTRGAMGVALGPSVRQIALLQTDGSCGAGRGLPQVTHYVRRLYLAAIARGLAPLKGAVRLRLRRSWGL
jgi:hypothetical protein